MSDLPKTYDHHAVEQKWYEYWEKGGFFSHKRNADNPDAERFSVVMPPPNVTGQLHLGHAMDNTMQDILTRWHRMQGHQTLWVPGSDHAGIATQAKVEEVFNAYYQAIDADNDTARAMAQRFSKSSLWQVERTVPFTSANKWSAVVFRAYGSYVVGAPEFIMKARYADLQHMVVPYQEQGCRVLLLARCATPPTMDGGITGNVEPLALAVIANPIREEAPRTFQYFAQQGVTVKVISGDNPSTVSAVAVQAGIAGGAVATLGLVFPSLVIIMVIAAFLQNFMHLEFVVHAFNGVRAGVVALIASSVIKLFKNAVIDWPTRIIYAVVLVLAGYGTFFSLPQGGLGTALGFVMSPVFLVIAAGAAGLCVRAAKGGLK